MDALQRSMAAWITHLAIEMRVGTIQTPRLFAPEQDVQLRPNTGSSHRCPVTLSTRAFGP
jgi:hypothetical protein